MPDADQPRRADLIDLTTRGDGSPRFDLHDRAARVAVEGALLSLPGVQAARIVPGYERAVDELHVVATPDRSPKTVVRDLQTLLMARFNIPTDHRVISIVQVGDEGEPFAVRRAVLQEVSATQHGLGVRVSVTLSDGDSAYTASEEGPASPAGRLRATARATLAAARPLLGDTSMCEVEGVAVEDVLGHELALALVHFHTGRGEFTLSGSALVTADAADAMARAVLDAVNREMLES